MLGAYVFYAQWIPHIAAVTKPLYNLLHKEKLFAWESIHSEPMEALKKAFKSAPLLRPLVYGRGLLIILTIDSSPFAVGWALSQNNPEGEPGSGLKNLMNGRGDIHRLNMNYGVQSVQCTKRGII